MMTIFAYYESETITKIGSWQDALVRGELIDVSQEAKVMGYELPVALTHAFWHCYLNELTAVCHNKQIIDEYLRKLLAIPLGYVRHPDHPIFYYQFTISHPLKPTELSMIEMKSVRYDDNVAIIMLERERLIKQNPAERYPAKD